MATSALLRLLALASILVLSTLTLPACVDPDGVDPQGDDDDPIADDDDALPTECTVEADGAINGTTVIAQKAGEDHVFATCVLEDGICSLLAPAGLDLVLYAEGENVVSCGIEVNLEPSATPHEITIPMGYGGTSHGYDFIYEDQILGTYEVETYCTVNPETQELEIIVHTHGAGVYRVVGDQLLVNQAGVSGSVTHDLEVYEFSTGASLVRQP